MLIKNKKRNLKLTCIGEYFFKWKYLVTFQRQSRMMETVISRAHKLKQGARLFIALLKNKERAAIRQKVASALKEKQNIANQTVNKLRFEITR